jgi:hypothetical protein
MRVIFRNKFVRWVLTPLVVLFGLGWGYYQINFPTCTFRYKLTAEVNTPDGLKTGSSVIEVSYSHNGDYGGGESPDLNLNGEAVYVDLGAGKNLFVTLTTAASGRPNLRQITDYNGWDFPSESGSLNPFSLLLKVFNVKWKYGQELELCQVFSALGTKDILAIPFSNLPTLVTFSDLHDLNSVKVVQPNDLGFDAGTTLSRVTIIPTTEPLQNRIDQVLDWLPVKKEEWLKHQDRAFTQGPLINKLYYDAFKAPGIWGDGGSGL